MQHVAAANEVAATGAETLGAVRARAGDADDAHVGDAVALASVQAGELAQALAGTGQVPGERGWTVRVRPRVGPLAAAGAGRWGQLACVSRARVLTRARETRAALPAPARRRAVP